MRSQTGTRPDYRHAKSSKQQLQQQQVLGSSQSETLTIKGSSKQAVSSARVRTQLLIDSVLSSRMLEYTHFVSIPLANAQTAEKLQEFQQQVITPGPDLAAFSPTSYILCFPNHGHQAQPMVEHGCSCAARILLAATDLDCMIKQHAFCQNAADCHVFC
jgi:hypothetical protein